MHLFYVQSARLGVYVYKYGQKNRNISRSLLRDQCKTVVVQSTLFTFFFYQAFFVWNKKVVLYCSFPVWQPSFIKANQPHCSSSTTTRRCFFARKCGKRHAWWGLPDAFIGYVFSTYYYYFFNTREFQYTSHLLSTLQQNTTVLRFTFFFVFKKKEGKKISWADRPSCVTNPG